MLGIGFDGSMLDTNRIIAKDIKRYSYCYVRCPTLIVRVGGMPWSLTGAFHYHAQLGLPDKSRTIQRFVVCYVVWRGSMGWVFGKAQGAWSGPMLLSGWLLSTATPHRSIQIHIIYHNL